MKNRILSLVLFCFLSLLMMFQGLNAQNKTVIKLNPLSFAAATINLQGERAINERMSIQLGGYYGGFKMRFDGGSVRVGYKHFGITPEFRYYFLPSNGPAPSGLFGAAFFRYRNVHANFDAKVYDPDTNLDIDATVNGDFSIPGGGVLIGYQALISEVVALDVFLGPQISAAKLKTEVICNSCNGNEIPDIPGFKFGGFGFRAGLAIGVAF